MTQAAKLTPGAKALFGARRVFGWLSAHNVACSGGLFLVALAAFVSFQASIIPGMGLWWDELFSLWAGDPSLSFGEAFATRILPDTNGPIYFSLVHLTQQAGVTGRAAFIVLNFLTIGICFAVILFRGWKAGIFATALSSTAIALVTAPVLVYAPEGRVYGLAMALCAVIAFEGGSVLSGGEAKRNDLIFTGILSALAAWMHVFGAIFAAAFAVALVFSGWLIMRRRDVVVLGLVMGGTTTAAFLVWMAVAFPLFTGTTSWIQFDQQRVFNAIWMMKLYLIGPVAGAVIAGSLVSLSLLPRHSRPIALTLAITGVLFIAIPLVVSFKMPIFLGRYLLVAGPALLILFIFLIRSHLVADGLPRAGREGLVALGALFLAFPLMQGFSTASDHFSHRTVWRGQETVLRVVDNCPDGEVRTLVTAPILYGFEYYLQGKLRPVAPVDSPVRDVSEINCPVFGWAEHYEDPKLESWAANADMSRVLNDFRLTNTTGLPLDIIRHPGGLVLAKADANLR